MICQGSGNCRGHTDLRNRIAFLKGLFVNIYECKKRCEMIKCDKSCQLHIALDLLLDPAVVEVAGMPLGWPGRRGAGIAIIRNELKIAVGLVQSCRRAIRSAGRALHPGEPRAA